MGLEAKLKQDGFFTSTVDALGFMGKKKCCMANADGNFMLCN